MSSDVLATIQRAIAQNEVILFMKGTRAAPSCGFSAKTVEVLDSVLGTYATVDVLAHPEIREGIKEFSSWPTIPQLYVRGKFVGGADIIGQLFEEGGLEEALGLERRDAPPPDVRVTEAAAAALRGYLGDSEEIVLLEIDREFHSGLSLGPRPKAGVFVSSAGITIGMDRLTASRSSGVTIDFVTTPEGPAFKVDNPNEPPKVKQMSVAALAERLKLGSNMRLIDVRTPAEWRTARIPGAQLLDDAVQAELEALDHATPLVFHCHHGHRSQRAAEHYLTKGFREVFNLAGGIDAWSQEIDSSVPRY
jgi:monothiol glutaredoxin